MISNATHLGICTTLSRRLGVEPPAALLEQVAALETAAQNLATLSPATDLPNVMLDAWLAGRDPLTDKKVQHAAIAQSLRASNMSGSIECVIDQRKGALLKQYADEWLASFMALIEEADATLTQARTIMPGLDFGDPKAGANLPPEHLEMWGRARMARARVHQTVSAWTSLSAAVCSTRLGSDRDEALIVADLSLEQFEQMRTPTIDAVLDGGYPLKLATFVEHDERVRRLADELQADMAADREARFNHRPRAKAPALGVASLMR